MNRDATETGFDRITRDPEILQGRACIRGMRVTVALIANLAANGMGVDAILDAYPYLEAQDIQQALAYAGKIGEQP